MSQSSLWSGLDFMLLKLPLPLRSFMTMTWFIGALTEHQQFISLINNPRLTKQRFETWKHSCGYYWSRGVDGLWIQWEGGRVFLENRYREPIYFTVYTLHPPWRIQVNTWKRKKLIRSAEPPSISFAVSFIPSIEIYLFFYCFLFLSTLFLFCLAVFDLPASPIRPLK